MCPDGVVAVCVLQCANRQCESLCWRAWLWRRERAMESSCDLQGKFVSQPRSSSHVCWCRWQCVFCSWEHLRSLQAGSAFWHKPEFLLQCLEQLLIQQLCGNANKCTYFVWSLDNLEWKSGGCAFPGLQWEEPQRKAVAVLQQGCPVTLSCAGEFPSQPSLSLSREPTSVHLKSTVWMWPPEFHPSPAKGVWMCFTSILNPEVPVGGRATVVGTCVALFRTITFCSKGGCVRSRPSGRAVALLCSPLPEAQGLWARLFADCSQLWGSCDQIPHGQHI